MKTKEEKAIYMRTWQKNHKENLLNSQRKYRQENPKLKFLKAAKRRAQLNGFEFNLEIEDIPDTPEICPIALIPIYPSSSGKRGPINNSPTIDRVNQALGYTKGNVRIISRKGNIMKLDMTIEDLERIIKYIKGEI